MVDKDAEDVLGGLPRMTPDRYPKREPNAWVYIDSTGRLCILPVDGGHLSIDEEDLDVLDGDVAAWAS